jgi:hypothetical protein
VERDALVPPTPYVAELRAGRVYEMEEGMREGMSLSGRVVGID